MTKLTAIAIAVLSVWLISAAAFATTCEARLTPLPTKGDVLVAGYSDARGAALAVVRDESGRILQQVHLTADPARIDGKVGRPSYGSFFAIAEFSADAKQLYSVSFVDLKKRVLCITYMSLKPTVSVQVSSRRPRLLAVEPMIVDEPLIEDDDQAAAIGAASDVAASSDEAE